MPRRQARKAKAVPSRSRKPSLQVPPRDDDNEIRVGSRTFPGSARTFAGRILNVLPDTPDIRDRIYQPHLRALHPAIFPRIAFEVRDQGADSSCTGYALANTVDVLRFREVGPDHPEPVSARMLYEMAKRNDEWDGTAYEGSSIRGALKGFFRNGVCSERTAPDQPGVQGWELTYDMAKEAKNIRLGAYYRVQPDVSDYHAAINEVGAIYVSAQVHSNWQSPKNGVIEPGGSPQGGHAFVIVGYDEKGFWILNSWGARWGRNGVAHWCYSDWAANIMDAWVLQLGVRAPDVFSIIPQATPAEAAGLFGIGDPNRADILGHFINIDDGRFVTTGKYGSPELPEMKQTVDRLTRPDANKDRGYEHLVIYAHGGLNTLTNEAKRISTWKRHDIFGRNRLYNFHLMWGSGLIDEAFGELSQAPAGRAAGAMADWLFEVALKGKGSYAWRNMKLDAQVAFGGKQFEGFDGGYTGLAPLLQGIDAAELRPRLHLVGHSAGAIMLGRLLSALGRFKLSKVELWSIHLMAPACTVDFFREHYGPFLSGNGALTLKDKIYLYNLTDELEREDKVDTGIRLAPVYERSLLYLVSRAYEDKVHMPLAGMQRFVGEMPTGPKLDIAYAQDGGTVTAATSHGDFDNDVATLTTIMSRIRGGRLDKPPIKSELTGY